MELIGFNPMHVLEKEAIYGGEIKILGTENIQSRSCAGKRADK